MDTLYIQTEQADEASHEARWLMWYAGGAAPKRGGRLSVRLAKAWTQDRGALAELAAIHHLIETQRVVDPNRCGRGLRILCSHGAIRKALRKGTLKSLGRGGTDKTHVAVFARFLATKYFQAEVDVLRADKWPRAEPKDGPVAGEMDVNEVPRVTLGSSIGEIGVTLHALNRVVARQIARDQIKAGGLDPDDLRSLPDKLWASAWKYLERNLPVAVPGRVSAEEHRRVARRYGASPIYLWHQDSAMVFVIMREPHGLELVTAMSDRYWAGRKVYKLYGQRVLPASRQ